MSGDGQEAPPNSPLPFPLQVGCANANNKPVANLPIRFTIVRGDGKLGPNNQTTVSFMTGKDGLVQCVWTLGSEQDQQVKAEMLDVNGRPIHLPIFFNAKSQFDQGNCTIVVRPGDDINALIGKLTADGGKVCFTSGLFVLKEIIQISNRSNILIEGSGASTHIVIVGSETAFLFTNCKNIHINHIFVQSLSPSNQNASPHIRGVATFLNCSEVKITDCNVFLQSEICSFSVLPDI